MLNFPLVKIFNPIKTLYLSYPRQYWLMIVGIVIATAGGSMIWPFLLIYAGGKLSLPLSTVATLITVNAGTGLIASFIAGTLADKIGRKVVMNFTHLQRACILPAHLCRHISTILCAHDPGGHVESTLSGWR